MPATKVLPLYSQGDSFDDVYLKLGNSSPDLFRHCVPLPNSRTEGHSPVFRNQLSHDALIHTIHPDFTTGYAIWQVALKRSPKRPYLGFRDNASTPYSYLSYEEVDVISRQVGSAILHLFEQHAPEDTERVTTLYFPNHHHFILVDLATQAYALPNTCLYDTLGSESASHILHLTKSPLIFTNARKVLSIAALKRDNNIVSLKIIITLEKLSLGRDLALFEACSRAGILLLDWEAILAIGAANLRPINPPAPSDVYSISFTSGTTSLPKGAIITQGSLVAFCINNLHLSRSFPKFDSRTRSFIFLPLAHVFARLVLFYELALGITTYFPTNPTSPLTYFEDIKVVKPTLLCIVPRVISKIEMALKAKFASSSYLTSIIDTKIDYLRNKGIKYNHFIFDRIVRKKVKAALGFDNLQLFVTGGAAVSSDSLLYLLAVFDIPFAQGYGLTETCAGICISTDDVDQVGTNGPVGLATEIKLKDIPEMNYSFDENKSGEILIRGLTVTKGYYKEPEKTREAIDADGWFHTGDIAKLDAKNRVLIVDRIKNFFKLAQGKFIAAENVENTYIASTVYLEQIFIYGDSLQSHLVAIIGVNVPMFEQFCKKHNFLVAFDFPSLAAIVTAQAGGWRSHPLVLEFVKLANENAVLRENFLKEINATVKDQLHSYEMVKNAYLLVLPFSVDQDTLTPTLKVKRVQAKKQFSGMIEQLYKEGSVVESKGGVRL